MCEKLLCQIDTNWIRKNFLRSWHFLSSKHVRLSNRLALLVVFLLFSALLYSLKILILGFQSFKHQRTVKFDSCQITVKFDSCYLRTDKIRQHWQFLHYSTTKLIQWLLITKGFSHFLYLIVIYWLTTTWQWKSSRWSLSKKHFRLFHLIGSQEKK